MTNIRINESEGVLEVYNFGMLIINITLYQEVALRTILNKKDIVEGDWNWYKGIFNVWSLSPRN